MYHYMSLFNHQSSIHGKQLFFFPCLSNVSYMFYQCFFHNFCHVSSQFYISFNHSKEFHSCLICASYFIVVERKMCNSIIKYRHAVSHTARAYMGKSPLAQTYNPCRITASCVKMFTVTSKNYNPSVYTRLYIFWYFLIRFKTMLGSRDMF